MFNGANMCAKNVNYCTGLDKIFTLFFLSPHDNGSCMVFDGIGKQRNTLTRFFYKLHP